MLKYTHDTKKIAKNTLYLYFRTILIMGVTIFTSRVILDVLGVEDYGIYNVVGGFVSMFSVLSGTLTVASQRFIAYELGKDNSKIQQVFSTTVSIHLLLALLLFFLLESFGLWFLNCKLNIENERLYAANWVFQCSIVTFCLNLICIPYTAAIVAYERMSAFAYISLCEVIVKLGCCYVLYIICFDSLILYAILMLIVAIILRVIYSSYCVQKCNGCKYRLMLDKEIFKEMFGFCGWNFIGSTASMLNGQGINILINIFFGVTLNAARGIANQIDNAVNTFVQNFMMALNPQITKSYAAGDFRYMNDLIIRGTKFAFFLYWIMGAVFFVNIDYILSVWLKQVPEYTALFLRCTIIYTMIQTFAQCLYTTILASGKIRKYQIIVSSLFMLAFPFTYIFFKMGFPAEFAYVSTIICAIVCLVARLLIMQQIVPLFSSERFVKEVIIKVFIAVIPTLFVIIWFYRNAAINFLNFILQSLVIVIVCIIMISLLGLNSQEKSYFRNLINSKTRI